MSWEMSLRNSVFKNLKFRRIYFELKFNLSDENLFFNGYNSEKKIFDICNSEINF